MNDRVLKDFYDIQIDPLKSTHDNYPFFHNIDINGKIKKYNNDGSILWMLMGFIAWGPANIFFQSMLNSVKLLEIKNNKLRTEIESIYTKHEERVNGMTHYNKANSDEIYNWFIKKEIHMKVMLILVLFL